MGNYSQRVISNNRSFDGEFDEDSTKGVRHGMAMKNKNKKVFYEKVSGLY